MGTGRLIVLAVAAVLVLSAIGFTLLANVRGRRAGSPVNVGPDASPGTFHARKGPSKGEATLRLSRAWSGMFGGQGEAWDIAIDGTVVGAIANQETVDVGVDPGHHTLRLGRGRHISPQRSFDVADGDMVSFRCHAPRVGGTLLAAQFNAELWITLKQE